MKTNGLVAGEAVNTPSEKPVRTRSRFPSLSYHFYNTERFGEYSPCFVMDCIEGDKVPILSGGRVSSYTLKAPLMQSISKKKDHFMVPMEAILPKNWQKFYTNPTVGDDVPDDCGTGVIDFWSKAYSIFSALLNSGVSLTSSSDTHSVTDLLTAFYRIVVLGEYFYSSGSLIKSLGASGNHFCGFRYNGKTFVSYDTWFDEFVSASVAAVPAFEFVYDGKTYLCVNDRANYQYYESSSAVVSIRTFLQMIRDDLTVYVSNVFSTTAAQLRTRLSSFFDTSVWSPQLNSASDVSYDLRRLWAYQIVCSHFYTNDHIDYVYSADILRNLVDFLVFTRSGGTTEISTFSWNGVSLQYDSMSAFCFSAMCTRFVSNIVCLFVTNGTTTADIFRRNILGFFSTLLSYRRSLRYVDYFTGSRSRPLAVGDVNVNVNSNLVNVVDISRNIQRQRFFNAVNRFGRRFEEYIKGLSGVVPDTDYHNPLYLAHTSDTVYGVETENTGAAQQTQANSVTSRLMSNGSRYQFEFEVDRPCVVIGLSYYDMPRAYLFATERQLFHMNRFDMFNPYMQFIGDQDVNQKELGCLAAIAPAGTFGYQLRHMEYKQRFDQAAGAFVDDLPGYLFTDRVFGGLATMVIDPHFIRSLNSELDSFYVALTGYSNGHYFHFIVDNDNRCDASRPMAFAPSIL